MNLPLEQALRQIAADNDMYHDEEKVMYATRELMENEIYLFHWYSLGYQDNEAIPGLLNWFTPKPGSILDIGSGIGFAAYAMKECSNSPLHFTLMNISKGQLDLSPPGSGKRVIHDIKNIPYPFSNGHFDNIMCLYSLGHSGPLDEFLGECYRLLSPGGILFIFDMISRNEMAVAEQLNYVCYSSQRVIEQAREVGFFVVRAGSPAPTRFNEKVMSHKTFMDKFKTMPVAYTFMKPPV